MLSTIKSATLYGLDGYIINVELDISNGLPSFTIVGLADAAIKEARQRVTSAIKNSGFDFPKKKIVVNLAPASIKKEGSGFDLAIAIGILSCINKVNSQNLKKYCFIGELALDGSVRKVRGALSVALKLVGNGNEILVLPKDNEFEASIAKIETAAVKNLKEAVDIINGEKEIKSNRIDFKSIFNSFDYDLDFSDIKGQQFAKRALEIAASGGHNIIMIGPPGSGKTMLASRLPTILPKLSFEESIETTRIYSAAGLLENDIVLNRPFRAPHHTISDIAMIGGGHIPRVGEVSLAHNGVLFLDEIAEFDRNVLEVLRQPLEKEKITISRASFKSEFPSKIMLVAASNPCPCGFWGHPYKECVCSPYQIRKYMSKISGPLLDRIDIHVEVPVLNIEDLTSQANQENSSKIRERVEKARNIQYYRYKDRNIYTNSQLTSKLIKEFCCLSDAASKFLKMNIERLGLSARAYDKILKLARTIADMEESLEIRDEHIAEAIQYRSIDYIIK